MKIYLWTIVYRLEDGKTHSVSTSAVEDEIGRAIARGAVALTIMRNDEVPDKLPPLKDIQHIYRQPTPTAETREKL